MTSPRSARGLHVLFFSSGAAALGYQILWAKMFAVGLGHEGPAVWGVVSAFFGGMSIGAWVADVWLRRGGSPARGYAVAELIIALWAFASIFILSRLGEAAPHWIGLGRNAAWHWAMAFGLPFAVLLPATAAMGATLPIMERFAAGWAGTVRHVGGLYAANTLGALAGNWAAAGWLMPMLGIRRSVVILAMVNGLCGAAAWLIGSGLPRQTVRRPPTPQAETISLRRLYSTLFFTGLLGIGFEVLGIRLLSQLLENTIYTFASILAVYLLGTAAGAAWYQWRGARVRSWIRLEHLLVLLSIAGAVCLGGLCWIGSEGYRWLRATLGDTPPAVLLAELGIAGLVFLGPAILMGATFSYLVERVQGWQRPVGIAVAVNTFGGAWAGPLFGVLWLPVAGLKWAVATVLLGFLVLVPRPGWRTCPALLAVAVLVILPRDLGLTQLPPDTRLVQRHDGPLGTVTVLESANGHRSLRVDNRFQMGGTAAAIAERRHAAIPLLLHGSAKRALFLGLGTGITFAAAGSFPGLQADGVELLPEVIRAFPWFEPFNAAIRTNGGLRVWAADARRYAKAAPVSYDVIVADLFHPARDGAGSLYTREHFRTVRERLNTGGMFCQWLPLHQMDETVLRLVVRTFLDVFPRSEAYLLRFNVEVPVLGLIGWTEGRMYAADWVERQLVPGPLPEQLKALALADSVRLFGCRVAGAEELRAFAGSGALNTDDRPVVTFQAPRFSYAQSARPYLTLRGLLEAPWRATGPPPPIGAETPFGQRLSGFMRARDVYLRGLMAEAEGRPREAVAAFIESARMSRDFTSGYSQCVLIASARAPSKPEEARRILEALVEAQPEQAMARELLQRLFEKP